MTASVAALAVHYRSYLENKEEPPQELIDSIIQGCVRQYVKPIWGSDIVEIPRYTGYQTILFVLIHLREKLEGSLRDYVASITPSCESLFSPDVHYLIDILEKDVPEDERPYFSSDLEALLRQLGSDHQYLIIRILQDKRIRRLAQVVFAGLSKEECQKLVTDPVSSFRVVMLHGVHFNAAPRDILKALPEKVDAEFANILKVIFRHASRQRHPLTLLSWLDGQIKEGKGEAVRRNAPYLYPDDSAEVVLPIMMGLSEQLWNEAARRESDCKGKLVSPALPFIVVATIQDASSLDQIVRDLIKKGDSPATLLQMTLEERTSYLQGLQTQRIPVLQGT